MRRRSGEEDLLGLRRPFDPETGNPPAYHLSYSADLAAVGRGDTRVRRLAIRILVVTGKARSVDTRQAGPGIQMVLEDQSKGTRFDRLAITGVNCDPEGEVSR